MTKKIPIIRTFFGDSVYDTYVSRYMTTALADELGDAIGDCFLMNIEPSIFLNWIMSAWGYRLSLASTGSGCCGANLEAGLQRMDIISAWEAMHMGGPKRARVHEKTTQPAFGVLRTRHYPIRRLSKTTIKMWQVIPLPDERNRSKSFLIHTTTYIG